MGEGGERRLALDGAYGTRANLYDRTRTKNFCLRLPLTLSVPTLFHLLNAVLCHYDDRKFLLESCTCCWTPRGKIQYKNDGVAHQKFYGLKTRFGTS